MKRVENLTVEQNPEQNLDTITADDIVTRKEWEAWRAAADKFLANALQEMDAAVEDMDESHNTYAGRLWGVVDVLLREVDRLQKKEQDAVSMIRETIESLDRRLWELESKVI